MERREFLKKSAASTGVFAAFSSASPQQALQKEVYELRVYELRWGQSALDSYLSKALIPALNKQEIKQVGVFTELGKSEPVKVYVLIPYPSFDQFGKTMQMLAEDKEYQSASTEFNNIPQEQAVFSRYESSLLLAFDGLPKLVAPKLEKRIFELRTYEGFSDDAVRRKVKMFNEGEFDIFEKTKLTPVFFGHMLIGKNMPCLTYMITFKDMQERDANWKAFGSDPDWQRISKLPEYENTVSKIYKVFLEPAPYSQI